MNKGFTLEKTYTKAPNEGTKDSPVMEGPFNIHNFDTQFPRTICNNSSIGYTMSK